MSVPFGSKIENIRLMGTSDSLKSHETARTVFVVWDSGMNEEFDVVTRRSVSDADIRKFVQIILDKDYEPGGVIDSIEPFSGVTFH